MQQKFQGASRNNAPVKPIPSSPPRPTQSSSPKPAVKPKKS